MKEKFFYKSILVITVAVAIILLSMNVSSTVSGQGSWNKPRTKKTQSLNTSATGLPVRIRIQKIKVDTSIDYVGLTKDGAMDAPTGPTSVGWYNAGPKPGEVGSSVIDGHSGWKNNIPAVFDNLKKLKKGDEIMVTNDFGVTNTFVITKISTYDQKAHAVEVFESNDGKAHLNLITCSGLWDKVTKSSSSRLVVFAEKQ